MNLIKAIEERHSVRSYTDRKIDKKTREKLLSECEKINRESGLNIQIVFDDKEAFGGLMAHYGSFKNVQNYIALIGEKSSDLQEKVGYFGEKLVLLAQTLGLNTCWVALTYNKKKCKIDMNENEKLVCVISLGYGETMGIQHKNKDINKICTFSKDDPEWFKQGVMSAMLAPTAMNQQKFKIERNENIVKIIAGSGFYTKLDLGIVKCHFEIGAGKENFEFKY